MNKTRHLINCSFKQVCCWAQWWFPDELERNRNELQQTQYQTELWWRNETAVQSDYQATGWVFFRFNLASRPAGNYVKSTQTCVLSPHSGAETLQYCFILSQHTNLHSQAKSSRRTLRPDTEVWLSCFPHLNSSCITFLSETVWTLVCFMPSWHFRHYRLSATGLFFK